jgi:RNA polymerase sigma-70 factor (ECF subfamily)
MSDLEGAWQAHRRRVFDVGYRMLGTITDADDVVQETYLRLLKHGIEDLADVEAWLVATAARASLDRLRRDTRRAGYVGPWLPEPIVSTSSPEDRVTLDETVQMALLVVMERLSPAERTSFLLHDVFGLSFAEVAAVVGRSEQACRQLAVRARRRITSDCPVRPQRSHADLHAVAERFAHACQTGSLNDLVAILDPDVVGDFDSGGFIPGAPTEELRGAVAVAIRLLSALRHDGLTFSVVDVNGDPGVVVVLGARVVTVISLTCDEGRVGIIHAIGNPEKLVHLGRGGIDAATS